MVAGEPSVHEFDRATLRQIVYAGAPIFRQDQDSAREVLGDVLVQFYGMAEVTSCITKLPAKLHGASVAGRRSVQHVRGRANRHADSIQDEQGAEQAAGTRGEVCVCGPGVLRAISITIWPTRPRSATAGSVLAI